MPNRILKVVCLTAAMLFSGAELWAQAAPRDAAPPNAAPLNLAPAATASTSFVSGHETLSAVNNGYQPANSNDKSHGAYGNWPQKGTQWVQYEWSQPISTAKIDVYWFDDRAGVRLPKACRLQYFNGDAFVPVEDAAGLGLAENKFNVTTFREVRTAKLRLEMDSSGESTGILQWRVFDTGKSPNFPPKVTAGADRVVVLGAKTFLQGNVTDDGKLQPPGITWSKEAGPGDVAFADIHAATTTAGFSATGEYVVKLTADDGQFKSSSTLQVAVVALPPKTPLRAVVMKPYKIDGPLWNDRLKMLITNWIPHCYGKLSDPQLPEGGIENFVQAANKLAGRPFAAGAGAPWSNAYVHNTVESMCWALMVDPQGDAEILAAQAAIRAKLDDWIPKILAAQEPNGYLHTFYTLNGLKPWTNKADHEGYTAGYFLEAAIAHYLMTDKADDRLYKAARKLADCWCDRIGPAPKRTWYDGHQELEQALVRLAWLVDDVEGPGKGRKYVDLAKFLLDCRGGGEMYDQSHQPVVRQYEAEGHAVRALYSYSGMAAVAMETGDLDYHGAIQSLWNNLVHRKRYVTGGVGSGETAEGFGGNFSLPNGAYCESCSSCGEIFFQHHLNLAYRAARHADLYEETMYNALLGSIDLEAKNFTYTNPLDSDHARYPWHVCPCCIGNIPRTLLMLPTWTYAKGGGSLYVNLFVGGTMNVGDVAGVKVEMVQRTDYPWGGKVSITVNPAEERRFRIHLRIPDRNVSRLYSAAPEGGGVLSLAVNGAAAAPVVEAGYAVLDRTWRGGDKIELELPMPVQRVHADKRVTADLGRVALRRGPLVYAIESVDQNIEAALGAGSELSTEWKPDLLRGVKIIRGRFADGAEMTAIPYYARNNRGGRARVWIQEAANRPNEPSAAIRIDLKDEKAVVPPTLYGIFMEEISHAFDGGIYGELIQNRSFEEGVTPPGMKLVKNKDGSLKMELAKLPEGVPADKADMPWPWNGNCVWNPDRALIGWSLLNEGGAKGEMKLTEANPMNAASSRSLAMTIDSPEKADGRTALVNGGYWGVNVQAGTTYALTFYLRPETYQGTLTATLETKEGKVLARRDFGAVEPAAAWKKYTAALKADGSDPQARFVLSFRGKGALQVDWVSLFPPTYKNRPNGLRPDLARYLEELKPAFIRYPGGCYVEGLSWESAPDWRTMVSPPEERPGTWGYWKYRSTDGFGYHEFLEFCEDIGADAMYVAFAGMTVHPENNWPLDKIDPVIQQTLDAIEYATGPVSSRWGAVRAKMGHPKPFPLKYVEIGNEHPPAVYGDYYKKFRAAIKAKYPQMTVIMSMFWSGLNPGAIERAGDADIDMVDEHAYRPSGWIRANFDYFDQYRRKPWSVYVGEYAHHHGGGDWSAAMDDSVYLMMLERNGDLVKLASYAPLFCNVNLRDWGVNLIEFDASRSFAHASYYVQKVFNENRPDVNLATTVDVSPKPDAKTPLFAGRFGLGAWNTLNEFKELRIYDEDGKLAMSDDFQTMDNWETPGIGQWKVENGVLKQVDQGKSPAMLLLKKDFKAGRVTVKARRVGGSEGFLMFFGAAGPDRYMFCNYGAAGNRFSAIQGVAAEGVATTGGGDLQGPIEDDRWYDISLVLTTNSAEMRLEGKQISRVEAQLLPTFFATAGYDHKSQTVVLKATNYRTESVRTEIRIEGATEVGASGRHILLSANEPTAENSLDRPDRIVPRQQPLSRCAPRFSTTLPPLSVSLLRIPAKQGALSKEFLLRKVPMHYTSLKR